MLRFDNKSFPQLDEHTYHLIAWGCWALYSLANRACFLLAAGKKHYLIDAQGRVLEEVEKDSLLEQVEDVVCLAPREDDPSWKTCRTFKLK